MGVKIFYLDEVLSCNLISSLLLLDFRGLIVKRLLRSFERFFYFFRNFEFLDLLGLFNGVFLL
jgi:hypothetical protein